MKTIIYTTSLFCRVHNILQRKKFYQSLFLAIGILFFSNCFAINKTAIGNAGQGWSNAANWSPSGVPQSGDSVIIPASITITVKGSVYGSLPNLHIKISGTLDFDPSGRLELSGSSVLSLLSGGRITSNGTSSEIIKIGNSVKFNGQLDGSINGPTQANAATGSSPNGFYLSLLSIKLVSFNYELINREVKLNWAALTDHDQDKFELQRSSPGSGWTTLAGIPVSNASADIRSYSFTDIQPAKPINYYRLKLLNNGTKETYSSILAVSVTTAANKLLLSPNPAISEAKLSWSLSDTADKMLDIKVFNASSTCVMQKKVPAKDNSLQLAVGQLPMGLYRIMVTDNQQFTQTTTLVKK